jgi:kinetochore protein Mis13/DSN1
VSIRTVRQCRINALHIIVKSLTIGTALPHNEVMVADFYKHIESEGLSEPRRMRQLLTWCATRAMGDKPTGTEFEDQSARMAGEVLRDGYFKPLKLICPSQL